MAKEKYGVQESYFVGDWVKLRGCKHNGPGRVEEVVDGLAGVYYTVKTLDGTKHCGCSASEMKPWHRPPMT